MVPRPISHTHLLFRINLFRAVFYFFSCLSYCSKVGFFFVVNEFRIYNFSARVEKKERTNHNNQIETNSNLIHQTSNLNKTLKKKLDTLPINDKTFQTLRTRVPRIPPHEM